MLLYCIYAHTHTQTQPKSIQLDIVRPWPPVTSCSFTHKLTSVTYQGPTASTAAPVTSSGNGGSQDTPQPKGVIVYANTAIPSQVGVTRGCGLFIHIAWCS